MYRDRTWTGDLEVGQVVTVTYSVTVGDEPDATMRNVVTSDDDRAVCVPAEDGNADCTTEHHTPPAEEPGVDEPAGDEPAEDEPDAPLPQTGASLRTWALMSGLILLAGGLGLLASSRRRAGAAHAGS